MDILVELLKNANKNYNFQCDDDNGAWMLDLHVASAASIDWVMSLSLLSAAASFQSPSRRVSRQAGTWWSWRYCELDSGYFRTWWGQSYMRCRVLCLARTFGALSKNPGTAKSTNSPQWSEKMRKLNGSAPVARMWFVRHWETRM